MDDLYGIWFITFKIFNRTGVNLEREVIHTGTVGGFYLRERKRQKNFMITNQFKLTKKAADKIMKGW